MILAGFGDLLWPHPTRDALTFALGAAGFLHELLLSNLERPYLIVASLALMGFPFVLNADSAIRREKQDK